MKIPMLDLKGQYLKVKEEIDSAIQGVVDSCAFINGPAVREFEANLGNYLEVNHAIGCANGTDALQIALMTFDLEPGDEVIVPAFTFAATAEVVALLGLVPVFIDVEEDTFNLKVSDLEAAISPKTKAIIPVHLFGQGANMEKIMERAKKHSLYVIEDNAQAIGARYHFSNGESKFLGTIGDIGCTSFFPTKNLGCYGDGGAMFTNSDKLAEKINMITDHGQKLKYYHDVIGCNSRLDSIQAAVLDVKLRQLDSYSKARAEAADIYRELLSGLDNIIFPIESSFSDHVYHQFTLRIEDRERLREHLLSKGIASMTYYPLSLNNQKAFKDISVVRTPLVNSEKLANEVLSLPMHTELNRQIQREICKEIINFYK